jgi:glycosyltransferase involved in cell wall biosynthesis
MGAGTQPESSAAVESYGQESEGNGAKELPTVSVVIPCYNYGHFLAACVDSVVEQRGVQTRILIIDDASTDDSAACARDLAARHPQVEVVVHAVNQGHINTYNEGLLEWADEDYVTLLSADDELPPGSLERSVRLMKAHPTVGMVYGGIEEFGGTSTTPATPARRSREIVHAGPAWLRKRCREAVNVVPTPGTVLRTDVQRAVGGYDPVLTHAGDFDMWLRVALVADIGYAAGPPQGRYRVHGSSMSDAVYREKLEDVRQRKLVFDSLFAHHSTELARAGIQAGPTYARLASQPLWWACRAYETNAVDPAALSRWLAFAEETYAGSRTLRAHRALRRRQLLGASVCRRTRIFIGTAVVRRLLNAFWWFRWKRWGG